MRRPGRATKLTPAVQQMIVRAVRVGVPLVTAAAYAGVSKTTVLAWIQRGEGTHARPPRSIYVEFVEAIQKASAEDVVRRVAEITKVAQGGDVIYEKTTTHPDGRITREVRRTTPEWTAHAWVLERRWPEEWGRKERLEARVVIDAAVAHVAAELGLTPAEVLREAQGLLKELDNASA